MAWRLRSNGDYFAPQRGAPPLPPKGYCIDARDKYLAHPILRDCEYRFMTKETLSCGKVLGIIECSCPSIGNEEVNQMECFTCKIPERSGASPLPSETLPDRPAL